MKKWCTAFYWFGVACVVLAIPSLIFNLLGALALVACAISCFFLSSVCSAVQSHLAMQKRMIENQNKILVELDSISRRMQ